MHILHANWSEGALCIWAESVEGWSHRSQVDSDTTDGPKPHAFAASHEAVGSLCERFVPGCAPAQTNLTLTLPAQADVPMPSGRLAHAVGHSIIEDEAAQSVRIEQFEIPAVRIEPDHVCQFLEAVERVCPGSEHESANGEMCVADWSVAYFVTASLLVRHLQAHQRFVPGLKQTTTGEIDGAWQPWLADEQTAERVVKLAAAMPPVVRASNLEDADPWIIIEDFLFKVLDAQCRKALIREDMGDAVRDREKAQDAHVAWMSGLLEDTRAIQVPGAMSTELVRGVRRWLGRLEDKGISSSWRLNMRLNEPIELSGLADLEPPGEDVHWRISFQLQSIENPSLLIEAEDIWLMPGDSFTIEGHRIDAPHELMLAELGRASRLYKPMERALGVSEPTGLNLSTAEAYDFLREHRPILMEQGIFIQVPEWWESPGVRLGAKLQIDSDPLKESDGEGGSSSQTIKSRFGLQSLVDYKWEISIGGMTLTLKEFEQLASRKAPLIRLNDQWVEVRPEDVQAAVRFIRENPGGQMRVAEAIRFAYGSDVRETGIPIIGMEATGWVGSVFGEAATNQKIPIVEQPKGFVGTLRPYQIRGLSWLAFLEQFGFGACLADDMGLGKTIQLLALLVQEREAVADADGVHEIKPTLLVVPMSVVGNWQHEASRFAPQLKMVIHHGPERLTGQAFADAANDADAVITTYALVHRDLESLNQIQWRRVVLDEAQYVKNPVAKQSKAVRELKADTRIALTGTPVENRLSELWSIMDFLNPEYLGTGGSFRKRFELPIERHKDQERMSQLRSLVQPFVLRRLKTDPTVLADLPEKIESREFSHLTPEQAELYDTCVRRMLGQVEDADGIHRRGLVLAGLMKLKQICNHPSQYLKDHDFDGPEAPMAARSGKSMRVIEMLREVLASGEQALIFTQFRQMGHLLAAMLRHELDQDVLFLHGGTVRKRRQAIVDQFQKADGSAPILVASLKAGGIGLNLTAATHVFHYDRWWNPAVEAQATDRAYRIGQTKTVQVHKFVVSGTLEERIDQMIEQKRELAENIISTGERWLTEMGTDELRDILTLRREAVGDEDEARV